MGGLLQVIDLPYLGSAELWELLLAGFVLAVLAAATFVLLPVGRLLGVIVLLVIVAVIGLGGDHGLRQLEEANRISERRALDERATALFAQTIQPESVFACIDGAPVPAMLEACERILFHEPQRVAAAVSITTQRLGYLADALEFAMHDEGYLSRIRSLRRAVEADPYGLVAHVLATEYGCTLESCERFDLVVDAARVKENMRVRRFEASIAKHAPRWPVPVKQALEPESPTREMTRSSSERRSPDGSLSERAMAGELLVPLTPAEFGPPPGAAPVAAVAPPAAAVSPADAAAAQAVAPAPPAPIPRAAAAKAKAGSPTLRRSAEPVPGLPRVVPADFAKERQAEEREPAAQAGRPGTPTSLAPPSQQQDRLGP